MKTFIFTAIFFILIHSGLVFSQSMTGQILDSRDGKSYSTVIIGAQTWMGENLAYYTIDGCDTVKGIRDYVKNFGYLYNWKTATEACPIGWHLPSSFELHILIDYLGGDSIAGSKMKEADTIHWNGTNTSATNESGFAALPSGLKFGNKKFNSFYAKSIGIWWTSTEWDKRNALLMKLYSYTKSVYFNAALKFDKYNVRCIKN